MHSSASADESRVLCTRRAASCTGIAFATDPQAGHVGAQDGPAGALGDFAVASEFAQAELGSLYEAAWRGASGALTCPMASKRRTASCTSSGTAPKSQECRNGCCTMPWLYMREESTCEKFTSVATLSSSACCLKLARSLVDVSGATLASLYEVSCWGAPGTCVAMAMSPEDGGTSEGLPTATLASLYEVSCWGASGACACARRNVEPSIRGLCFSPPAKWKKISW